jgi:hypothetical protein
VQDAQTLVIQDPQKLASFTHGPEARVTLNPLVACTIAMLVSGALTGLCAVFCGLSLALFIGGLFFLTTILPPLILTQATLQRRLLVAGCVVDGIAIVWLTAVFSPQVSFMDWLGCYGVLIAYATLLSGVVIGLTRLRLPSLTASAITVTVSLVWLTWPVWLSPYLTGPSADAIVARLAAIHPLFAINGVLVNLGTWSHLPIAYRELTTLGQDVPYTLPTSVWPMVLVHLLPGIALLCIQKSTAEHSASNVQC